MKSASSPMHFPVIGFVVLSVFVIAAGCASESVAPASPEAAPADPGVPSFKTADYGIRLTTVAGGLTYPYCFVFLPDGSILLTEMGGSLRLIRDGVLAPEPIAGIPAVHSNPPSHGLMDIILHPNYAQNKWVYFTYNKPGEKGSTQAVARGVFDGTKLTEVKDIFVADAWAKTNGRQNSRIVFGRDGMLYMTASVGGDILRAQNMNDHAGKVLRIRDDGTVPPDNPYVGRSGHRPEIFTNGHGNIHGLAIHPVTGDLWGMEHGDEANILRAGGNYGWPFSQQGQGTSVERLPMPPNLKLTDAVLSWNPQRRVSGIAFYTGDTFPNWKNNMFLGTLNEQEVHRVVLGPDNKEGLHEDLFTQTGLQVRDVREGPDGRIYFTSFEEAGPGRLLRIEPEGS